MTGRATEGSEETMNPRNGGAPSASRSRWSSSSPTRRRPIVVAPMIFVGLIVRKWLVTGLTLGAVTGE
ncbi:MAG TPA: hypothetical protein VGJ32_12795 [Solirubrobacteraceae bacterium]|jgi:hypothetical protein